MGSGEEDLTTVEGNVPGRQSQGGLQPSASVHCTKNSVRTSCPSTLDCLVEIVSARPKTRWVDGDTQPY